MPKISPFLWFDNQAEEAAKFYTSIFPNSRIKDISHYDDASAKESGQKAGSVLVVNFELDGQEFNALNGGPIFKFSEAVSFAISCQNQEEVDNYWNKLTADGGEESQCGWLKDKFGLSWQVVPVRLNELLADPDPLRASRAMKAMIKMKKLNIQELEDAANATSD